MLVPLSVTRLPPSLKEALGLCVPASQRVYLCRGTGAPAFVRKIVLTWRRTAYRPHSHFPQRKQARLYARWLFLASNFLELRRGEVVRRISLLRLSDPIFGLIPSRAVAHGVTGLTYLQL